MPFPHNSERSLLRVYALSYRDGADVPVTQDTRECVNHWVDYWYGRIACPVHWVPEQPYETFDAMAFDIARGEFKVHCPGLKYSSRVFGNHYRRFRAVHDYFGHYCANNGFGLLGELSAYGVHCAQFPAQCHPLIFNELVLVNSYKDYFGHYSDEDKLVILA